MMEQIKSFGTDSHLSQGNLVGNKSFQHALQNKLYKGIQGHCVFHVTYKTTPNDLCGKLKTVQCLGENAL